MQRTTSTQRFVSESKQIVRACGKFLRERTLPLEVWSRMRMVSRMWQATVVLIFWQWLWGVCALIWSTVCGLTVAGHLRHLISICYLIFTRPHWGLIKNGALKGGECHLHKAEVPHIVKCQQLPLTTGFRFNKHETLWQSTQKKIY